MGPSKQQMAIYTKRYSDFHQTTKKHGGIGIFIPDLSPKVQYLIPQLSKRPSQSLNSSFYLNFIPQLCGMPRCHAMSATSQLR
jgi:hypothetical protein